MTTTEVSRQTRRRIGLNAFDSSCGVSEIGKVVVGNGIVPSRDVNALGREVASAEPNPVMVDALSQRVNETVYGTSEHMYGLVKSGESPQAFFQRQMLVAQDIQILLAERVNPQDPFLTKPQGDFETPADIVKHLADPDVEKESKDMLTTRLALALVLAEQESYFAGTEQVRKEVDDMFANALTPNDRKPVYTVHNNETNKVKRFAPDLDTLFAEPIVGKVHVKKHLFDDEYQQHGEMDEVGEVAILSRIKSEQAAALKTVRLAILRQEKEDPSEDDLAKGDSLDVTDVTDLIGSTVIVMGAESSNSALVTTARQKIIQQFKEQYPHLTDENFRDKSRTQGRTDSKGFDFQRIIVDGIPGLQGGYEVFFFGQDYFNYKYEVGTIDPATDEPTGPAHPVYRDLRYLKTYRLINDHIDDKAGIEIKHQLVAKDVHALLEENRVDVETLQKEYNKKERDIFVGSSANSATVFSFAGN